MDFNNRNIQPDKSLIDALKQMDALDSKLLIVVDNEKFIGLLSAGDIQRAIIKNKPLGSPISEILRKKVRIAKPDDSFDTIENMMLNYRMELCPVVDKNGFVEKIYFWTDLFQEKKPKPAKQFNIPIVIMAGGIGTRLKPLTNVLPKPLIPIGNKTIIEEIFNRFGECGCNEFHISLNYKAELIEFYLKNANLDYKLHFFREKKPMGTAGSLSLLKGKLKQTFFVSNCDILIEQDYSEILDYHKKYKNEITVIAALKNYHIPYGTIETGRNGLLIDLTEKPDLTIKINSGMYILEPHILSEIKNNKFFHITHLIEKVILRGGKVGVFPVSEKSWKDVGDWKEFLTNVY
jgi:dTDP-glucose pyrophosphorylase